MLARADAIRNSGHWKTLSDAEKGPFLLQAQNDKARFEREKKVYEADGHVRTQKRHPQTTRTHHSHTHTTIHTQVLQRKKRAKKVEVSGYLATFCAAHSYSIKFEFAVPSSSESGSAAAATSAGLAPNPAQTASVPLALGSAHADSSSSSSS